MFEVNHQGSVLELRRVQLADAPQRGGGIRGKIEAFSAASRRRLIELLARMTITRVRTVFMTLTFSGTPTAQEAKKAFKRFSQWVRRSYPQASAVWRLERQKRGAIHFHLIAFRLPYIAQKALQERWEKCTREAMSIVDIRLVKSKRGVMAYVSKYVAKRSDAEGDTSLDNPTYQHTPPSSPEGRFWGYINRESLPLGKLTEVLVEDGEIQRYAWSAVQMMSRGRGGQNINRALLYTQEGAAMLRHIISLAQVSGTLAEELLCGRARRKWDLRHEA